MLCTHLGNIGASVGYQGILPYRCLRIDLQTPFVQSSDYGTAAPRFPFFHSAYEVTSSLFTKCAVSTGCLVDFRVSVARLFSLASKRNIVQLLYERCLGFSNVKCPAQTQSHTHNWSPMVQWAGSASQCHRRAGTRLVAVLVTVGLQISKCISTSTAAAIAVSFGIAMFLHFQQMSLGAGVFG